MEQWMHFDFPEGEGRDMDATGQYMASIEGADWVMPDGSIAQAVELFIGESYELISAAGDNCCSLSKLRNTPGNCSGPPTRSSLATLKR